MPMFYYVMLNRYILTRRVEKMVPLRRLTTIIMPHRGRKATLRPAPKCKPTIHLAAYINVTVILTQTV
jgi:hypothetical protein